jgi:hypothetical protein
VSNGKIAINGLVDGETPAASNVVTLH